MVVLTPHSVASKNVLDEVAYALHHGKDVVPVLLASCDVPFRLHRIQYIDFTRSYATGLAQCCTRLNPGVPDDTTAETISRAAGPVDDREADRPGVDMFRDFDRGPEMIRVPRGRFLMGSPPGEAGGSNDERPQHEVSFAREFAVGRFPVTFAQWAAALADSAVDHVPKDYGWGVGNRPVIDVSWDDAQKYIGWLSERSGKPYRLPTESEWEYVARAGTTSPFWCGSTISSVQANFDARYAYGDIRPGEYRKRTVPVDTFQPNPWGLYQVHGNVWEWCQDSWVDGYHDGPRDGTAREPAETVRSRSFFSLPDGVHVRVVRGGSWKTLPKDLRSARRSSFPQNYRGNSIGFRVARQL